MMSVLEYALDIKKDVGEVIERLNYLGFDITNEDDELTDDMIIELDNSFQNDDVFESVEEQIDETTENFTKSSKIKQIDDSVKKQKLNI